MAEANLAYEQGWWLDFLQWPALLVTVIASWLVSKNARSKRKDGFWIYLVSNLLWIAWGLHVQAYALVALQLILGITNIIGMRENRS